MDKTELLKDNRDELTGLLEKQAFYVWAQELIDTAEDVTKYAFVFFDMDNFKLFNANYGFEKGDALLIKISEILKDVFENQLIARFSGDHFVACVGTTQLIPFISKIKNRVKEIQKNINLELKAGVYVLDGEITDVVRCSDRARMACTSIKKKYDVDYKFYDDELGGTLIRKQFILDNLDEALREGYIQVYYQPIVRTLTGKVCGWEALVRWIDPVKGVVYPNEFISVLEEHRLIHKLDTYVMEQVFSNISRIRKQGRKEAVPVSINLSRLDFESLDIVPFIDELSEKYDIDKSLFKFEITESVLMENPRFIQEQIARLREKGYGVWMDDFGSGYSSLNVLKNFEFDLVKIDMEFLRGFESSDDGKIIIRHMVSMLKNLGFHTLAEGVETEEQRDFLKTIGCELIQGYLIGRPMPFDEGIECLERAGLQYEKYENRKFYNEVGKVDLLKQNPLEGEAKTMDYSHDLPLAIGLLNNGKWTIAYSNEAFRREMSLFGCDSIDIVERLINNQGRNWMRRDGFIDLCNASKLSGKAESMEYVSSGRIINIRVRYLALNKENQNEAFLFSLRSLSKHLNESYEHKNSIVSNYLFSFYECIDLYGLDNDYYENIYLTNSALHVDTKGKKPNEIIEKISEVKIHKNDKEVFLQYMDITTVRERLASEKNGVKIAFFRVREPDNNYTWKSITIKIINFLEKEVMLAALSMATKEFSYFMNAFIENGKEEMINPFENPKDKVEKYAFENILRLVPVGVFWKDMHRRFVGANQMFLDYYGLKSVDSIIGKTDEDMGWHINPEPFKKDELAVINNGEIIKNVEGECIVHGEVRKIRASKQPFKVNGETLGLIGFFSDVTEQLAERDKLEYLSRTDELTGMLNRRAFDDIIKKYIAQFEEDNTDFVMFLIDIDRFKQINDMYGHDFGDEVLKKAASIIRNVTANNSVAFRIGGDEFAVLHQFKSEIENKSIIHELNVKFNRIRRIAGLDIKVRASIGSAFYSEAKDEHELINIADRHMYEDKETHK
ncbi:diguanylate cyclase (GGDEF) domain-containing protein [Pseudobutyrivibrio sp. OR37]|uniref:EAL domain-containing protein n=1 Tax=Pseudobutyrivibrio sp. OR37 TaxID=1798186 RepID=UPI0008F295D7|nr:EAL domain-containing protein [Pseudobutyrivibrio sp. OR37]SFH75007.1 diguanylate cyclase (GGDEF) domain-containing protein [Pseudobutyrivibrio sp. OR37]